MTGHSSSIFASFQVDDFHKKNQISNGFDSVLKKVDGGVLVHIGTATITG